MYMSVLWYHHQIEGVSCEDPEQVCYEEVLDYRVVQDHLFHHLQEKRKDHFLSNCQFYHLIYEPLRSDTPLHSNTPSIQIPPSPDTPPPSRHPSSIQTSLHRSDIPPPFRHSSIQIPLILNIWTPSISEPPWYLNPLDIWTPFDIWTPSIFEPHSISEPPRYLNPFDIWSPWYLNLLVWYFMILNASQSRHPFSVQTSPSIT